jgi:hypothetical protein
MKGGAINIKGGVQVKNNKSYLGYLTTFFAAANKLNTLRRTKTQLFRHSISATSGVDLQSQRPNQESRDNPPPQSPKVERTQQAKAQGGVLFQPAASGQNVRIGDLLTAIHAGWNERRKEG